MKILAQETIKKDLTWYLIEYGDEGKINFAYGINLNECKPSSFDLITRISVNQLGTKEKVLRSLSEMIDSYKNKANQYIQESLWEGLIKEKQKEIKALEQFVNVLQNA